MTNEKKQIKWDRNEQEEAAIIEQTGIYGGKPNKFFNQDEWDEIKNKADKETFSLLEKWVEDNKDYRGLPFPILTINAVVTRPYFIRKEETDKRFSNLYDNYTLRQVEGSDKENRAYGQLYRIIAFMIYGYGNWSNNARRAKGLAPIRKG